MNMIILLYRQRRFFWVESLGFKSPLSPYPTHQLWVSWLCTVGVKVGWQGRGLAEPKKCSRLHFILMAAWGLILQTAHLSLILESSVFKSNLKEIYNQRMNSVLGQPTSTINLYISLTVNLCIFRCKSLYISPTWSTNINRKSLSQK